VPFKFLAESLTTADSVLQVANPLADGAVTNGLPRLAESFGQVVTSIHEAAKNFHELEHSDIPKPVTEYWRP